MAKRINEDLPNDGSSGDEAQINKCLWQAAKNNYEHKVMQNELVDPIDIATWPSGQDSQDIRKPSFSSADRASPPLYEVELTASDEDDDASVLELVIPMKSSRYQRVPTSSPKKVRPRGPRFFCSLFCCFRK